MLCFVRHKFKGVVHEALVIGTFFMLYTSKLLLAVKATDRTTDPENSLGMIERSTLPLQNTFGVSLLFVLLWGAIAATAYHYWQLRKTRQQLKIEKIKTQELAKKLSVPLMSMNVIPI